MYRDCPMGDEHIGGLRNRWLGPASDLHVAFGPFSAFVLHASQHPNRSTGMHAEAELALQRCRLHQHRTI